MVTTDQKMECIKNLTIAMDALQLAVKSTASMKQEKMFKEVYGVIDWMMEFSRRVMKLEDAFERKD